MTANSWRGRSVGYLWVGSVVALTGVTLYPISNRHTRLAGIVIFVVVWLGALALAWRRPLARSLGLAVSALAALLLLGPGRATTVPALRDDYVAGLRRYDRVRYVWGGEGPTGIDCSGLVRRGLVDALFCRGVRTANPALVRQALSLWWHDCTAEDLGLTRSGLTVPQRQTRGLNDLEASALQPGDLAVTTSGIHILAYLGNNQWTEADPSEGRVVTASVPNQNPWFSTPMRIVRWRILSAPGAGE